MTAKETGLAFSGGGIRSAALCSGVLRRLLQEKAKVDYVSCVSGGGYTGTAFLDWKYRKEKKEDDAEEWHEQFFDHMRRKAGYLCDWEKPLIGIRDTIVLFFLVLIVTFILPNVIYGSYAFPVAFIIDYIFGKCLRDIQDCDNATAIGIHQSDQNATAQGIRQRCLSRQGTWASTKIVLFSILGVLFVIFYILSRRLSEKFSQYFIFLSAICFLFFSFTFFPFAIHSFFIRIPLWSQLVVVVIGIVLWFFLPLLRDKTSYGIIIYLYSYIIYWKVYEAKIVGIAFSVELFNQLLFASGFILWFVPYLDASRKRLIHVYNRWRLQKAFYSKESQVTREWLERFQEVFCPLWTCVKKSIRRRSRQHMYTEQQADILRDHDPRANDPFTEGTEPIEKRALNLGDLGGMAPEYISNVTVQNWKKNENSDRDSDLLTMSPTRIERLDRDPSSFDQFKGKLEPRDVGLSDAMATSAAAISGYDSSLQMVHLHTVLGWEMGTTMISNFKAIKAESCFVKVVPLLINVIRGLPLIAIPAIYYRGGNGIRSIEAGVITFFVIHLILALIGAFADTGTENPKWWQKIAGWFIVHVSFVNFVRQALSMENIGPVPPPVMLLSDGGHMENLGILPLLKKKLKRIIVVDGSSYPDEKSYGQVLLKALMLARTKLNCSFIGVGGRDVISDLLENFVKPQKPNERKPRHYKFRVEYYQDDAGKVGEGEILFIRARDPRKGEEREVKTWEEFGFNLEPRDWGNSPYLTEEDVDKLTFCCCACCNKKSWLSCLSVVLCNKFPNTATANQFFTPLMFSAYHREGFRACVEANAAEFLKDDRGVLRRNSEHDNLDV